MNTITSEVTITGSYEAVAEVCMASSSQLAVSISRGGFSEAYVKAGPKLPIVVEHNFLLGMAGLHSPFVDAPVRFLVEEPVGWTAPLNRFGFHCFETHGIEMVQNGATEAARITFIYDSDASPPVDLVRAMSARFPDVVATIRVENTAGHFLCAGAYRGGELVRELSESELPSTETVSRGLDDCDTEICSKRRNAAATELLRTFALKTLRQAPRATDAPVFGFPRWSLLAHVAYDGGIKALVRALCAAGDSASTLRAELLKDVTTARRLGIASWADTLLYGALKSLPTAGLEPLLPHSDLSPMVYVARIREVLATLGGHCASEQASPEREAASALLSSLSDPSVRLLSGMQPVAHLAASCGNEGRGIEWKVDESAARSALDSLTGGLAARVTTCADGAHIDSPLMSCPSNGGNTKHGRLALSAPDMATAVTGESLNASYVFDPREDKLLASVLAIALQDPSNPQAHAPALNVGVAPSVVYRSALCSALYDALRNESRAAHAFTGLLSAYTELYGSPLHFPADLAAEMAQLGPTLKPLHEAACNAARMRETIDAAQVGVVAAEPAPRRRTAKV